MRTSGRRERVVELADGLRLGVAEFGDLDGPPLFAFHGTPSCRLNLTFVDDAARRRGVRVIAPDRWGIGLSRVVVRSRLVSWADDLAALADELGIARFGVMGLSGGGPYGLACAARLPDRVDGVAIVSSPGPVGMPGLRADLGPSNRALSSLAVYAPIVLRGLLWGIGAYARNRPASFTRLAEGRLPEPDRKALSRSRAFRAAYAPMTAEAMRGGTRGCALDYRLQGSPWGFDPAEISAPVHLWHGDMDRFAPPSHGEWMAARIRDATMHWCAGEGHLLVLNHTGEIIDSATPGRAV